MYPTLVFVSPSGGSTRIINPVAARDDVYFETWSERGVTRVFRIEPERAPHQVLVLTNGHPDGTVIACEEDGLVCRLADDMLAVIEPDSGRRHPLHRLVPSPAVLAVTPEHVTWCSARTDDQLGEVWRWWRGAASAEQLGTHDSTSPLLAIRPVPLPYPANRLASDVAIAANLRLGLIDTEGLDWIASVEEPIRQLACTEDVMVFTTEHAVQRCDLDTEELSQVYQLPDPPLALTARDDEVFVAINSNDAEDIDRDEDPAAHVVAIDVADGSTRLAAPFDDPTWARGGMALAAASRGLYVIETGSFANIDWLTYLPHDWRSVNWHETLQVQRWLPDGSGGQLMLERGDWWCGLATGEVPPDITEAVNQWLQQSHSLVGTDRPVPGRRGWQVSIGESVWFCAFDDYVSITAIKIAKLVSILAPHVPPLAAMASLPVR